MAEFDVFVSKADFKFNCAHFIIFDGFRERLHGHNYQMSVRVTGEGHVGNDGYLIDFGDIKKVARLLCKEMNEYFICPMRSPELSIVDVDGQICIECPDGAKFSFPKRDCVLLPVLHSSAEELSHYFWCMIIKRLGLETLHSRGIQKMEVTIAEAHNQSATYRAPVPKTDEDLERIATTPLNIRPRPCFADEEG